MASKKNSSIENNLVVEDNKATESITDSVALLDLFDDNQLDRIGNVYSTYNFGVSGYKKFLEEVGVTSLNFPQVTNFVVFLRYLQDNLGTAVKDKKNFEKSFIEFLKYHEFSENEAQNLGKKSQGKLWQIYNSRLENMEWHQTGLLDLLLDFDGFIDIRPVFYESKVTNLLPIIIFRGALQKDYENPRNVVFQMSPEDFSKFETTIKNVRDRLDNILSKMSDEKLLNIFAQ